MNEEKGRELFRFFPEVSARLKARWIVPDYHVSQILTGHGCFRKRLHDMKLCEDGTCYCGMADEDLHHVLCDCPLYEDLNCEKVDGISCEGAGCCTTVTSVAHRGTLAD